MISDEAYEISEVSDPSDRTYSYCMMTAQLQYLHTLQMFTALGKILYKRVPMCRDNELCYQNFLKESTHSKQISSS